MHGAVKKIPKESAIERELVLRVLALGGMAEKVQVIGKRGFFDRLVILPGGRIYFCECKRSSRAHIATHQILYATKCIGLGCNVALIRTSADIDRLLAQ